MASTGAISTARILLKKLVTGNPVTGALYKRRFERHLASVLQEHQSPCRVHPVAGYNRYAVRKGDNVIIANMKDAVVGGTIADRFDIFFNSTQPAEVNGLKMVDYSEPKVYTLPSGLQFEIPSLPEAFDALQDQIARYQPKPGDTVFDCGAYAGISTYHFSQMVGPTGRVICFEPDSTNVQFLRRNIQRHNLQNVTVVETALGATDGTAQFYSEGSLSSGMGHLLGRPTAGNVIEIPMLSLASAFEKYGAPNLCKIDIEGAEIEVLRAAAPAFSKLKINFVVDTDHWVENDTSAKRVNTIFREAGYEAETVATINEKVTVTYAWPKSLA